VKREREERREEAAAKPPGAAPPAPAPAAAAVLALQQSAGNQAVGRMLARETAAPAKAARPHLDQIDEELGSFNTDEGKVIRLMGECDPSEMEALQAASYRVKIAGALDAEEMARAMGKVSFPLFMKIDWLREVGTPKWGRVRPLIIDRSVSQDQKNRLKTDLYRDAFVEICNNAEMKQAVTDLNFDLATKLKWMCAEGTDFELVSEVIRTSRPEEGPEAYKDPSVMKEIRGELSSRNAGLVERMLKDGLLAFGDFTNKTEGVSFTSQMSLWRDNLVFHKEINFQEKGTFNAGDYAKLKGRCDKAVTDHLSRKFKLRIASPGPEAKPGDGVYPIAVRLLDKPGADYDVRLHGQTHGRSSMGSSSGDVFELGQDTETEAPDVMIAHEFGHAIIGAPDEYADADDPDPRTVYTDNSLMGDFYKEGLAKAEIKARHFSFAVKLVKKYFPDRIVTIEK
jgi:hypothetical protein